MYRYSSYAALEQLLNTKTKGLEKYVKNLKFCMLQEAKKPNS
jgi:hypothetical protein